MDIRKHHARCSKCQGNAVYGAVQVDVGFISVVDVAESVDYPIQGLKVARAVVDGVAERGIALCGTGIGISIACNKVKGIRAVVCSEPFSAKLSRQHNNSNILCMGGRVVGPELAKMIVQEWLDAEFEGGRHRRRVGEIREIEETGTIKEA